MLLFACSWPFRKMAVFWQLYQRNSKLVLLLLEGLIKEAKKPSAGLRQPSNPMTGRQK